MNLIRAISVGGSVMLVCFSAGACQLPTELACTVRASPGKVVTSFPILSAPFVWRWQQAETSDNELEYRWDVAFGACGNSGHFDAGEYAYGVQLFKYPGSTPRTGQLKTLLSAAQHTFVRRDSVGGRVAYSMVSSVAVTSHIQGGALEVTVSGQDEVAQLLARLPRHALLTVKTPIQGGSYQCIAEVQYPQ